MEKKTLSEQLGLLRSWLIYYGKPFNRWRMTRFYHQFIKPGELCFDLGAHLGNRSDAWLQLGATVVAVEPQPICIEYLEKKFGHHPRFTLVSKAVGENQSVMELHISDKTPTITTLAGEDWQQAMQDVTPYDLKWDHTMPVDVITLDDLIEVYGLPRFCKIDVEDFELQVLRGLSQPIPCLSFEYFIPTIDRAIGCIHKLESLGDYQYNWSVGETQRFTSQRWLTAEKLIDILSNFSSAKQSGDVYARLIS